MIFSKKKLWGTWSRSDKSDDFVIGKDNFSDLQISPTPSIRQFYYFFHKKDERLIKQFVLEERPQVDRICVVVLIKSGNKFTPRLSFSIRDKTKKIDEQKVEGYTNIKARVSLADCHKNFWELISFLQSLKNEIDIPEDKFFLVSQDEKNIISALRGRGADSVVSIAKQLLSLPNISLAQKDIKSLLKRKEKLIEFEQALSNYSTDESWWQEFFEKNNWIFGYGLNYEILEQQQPQPNYGGTGIDGTGGQRGDNLMSTMGDLNFTVLVEIKTPSTQLLQGAQEIRNGAWSLSKNLIDAISQIQANIQMWEKYGASHPDNIDKLERKSIFTIRPKGIIVIGSLHQFINNRSKRETFQRFRKSIHGIDIITFDELFERAKFIVEVEND